MVAGIIGVLLAGAFATWAGALVVFGLAYPLVLTIAILRLADRLVGQRVDPAEQALALDTARYGAMATCSTFREP
jgi:ammonia channel protein AmtB